MKVNCFRISEGPKLTVCEYSSATEAINQKTARVWIDILDADTSELEWLKRRIEVMRSLIDMHAQDRTNRRLGRLTVLSMVFMSVTFLARIWGMNFKSMPLMSSEYGYISALIIMLLISGGMYFYFHRKGWFG
jgi:magnesium transporter